MKYMPFIAFISLCAFSLTGCAELKQLRMENADLKCSLDQINKEKQACREALQQKQDQLTRREVDLRTKDIELEKKQAMLEEQSRAFTRTQEDMKTELESKQVEIRNLEGKLSFTIVDSILFESGRAEIKPEGMEALKKVADMLKDIQNKEIIVAGYTDSTRIMGNLAKIYPSNWELSAARAISVVKVLLAGGVDPELISTSGFGEYRPVAENNTPEGRAKNRRMEIMLVPKLK